MSEETPSSPKQKEDPLFAFLHRLVAWVIKLLAVLMIIVIFASVVDVVYILYENIIVTMPVGYFHIEGILTILGAFIAVLIAIEIFNNIVFYLKEDKIHIKLVLATALIAISRKVIVLDYTSVEPNIVYAIAVVILATAVAYWIVSQKATHE